MVCFSFRVNRVSFSALASLVFRSWINTPPMRSLMSQELGGVEHGWHHPLWAQFWHIRNTLAMSRLPFPLLLKATVQIVTSLFSHSAVTQLLKRKSYSSHVVGHHLFASGAADQGLGAGLTLIWNDKCWQRPESSVVQNPYFSAEKRNVWSDKSSFTMF